MCAAGCADWQRRWEERWATGQADRSLLMMISSLSIVRPREQSRHARSWSIRSGSRLPKPWRASVVSVTLRHRHWEYNFIQHLMYMHTPILLSILQEFLSAPFIPLRRAAETHRGSSSEEYFVQLPVLWVVKCNHRSHSLANSSHHILLQKKCSKILEVLGLAWRWHSCIGILVCVSVRQMSMLFWVCSCV